METSNLDAMFKGWFIGDFEPTLFRTQSVEVAVKKYAVGDTEESHFHKIATEFTVIVTGRVRMAGQVFGPGEIIRIAPNESTDFEALEEATTVVVKIPGAQNDKYPGRSTE